MDFEAIRELGGRKRTLEILAVLEAEGPLNFSDIEREVNTSSDIITDRLTLLRDYGLVDRTERSQRDVRYTITEKGEDVLEVTRRLERLLKDNNGN